MKRLLILYILTLGTLAGCKKFVEVGAPKTQLVTTTVFDSNESATAALLNLYAQMMITKEPTPYQMGLYTGIYADELRSYSSLSSLGMAYQNNLMAQDATTNKVWTQGYNYIYQCNAVYEGCLSSAKVSAAVKMQLMAEALFLRSFWYFYLVGLYGDVPLILTTDYQQNAVAPRTDKGLVYAQLVRDLTIAKSELSPTYIDGQYASTTERLRPNRSAASALLARVYLFTGNYAGAEAEASAVITGNGVYDLVGLDQAFLKNNREAIWQLAMPLPNSQALNTTEGRGYVLSSAPVVAQSERSTTTISSQLQSAFEPGDRRASQWIGTRTQAGTTYPYPNKYKVASGSVITEYSTVLRLAEQYLIRAEARAQQGNLDGAISDIDAVRRRAGLPTVVTTLTNVNKAGLFSAVLHERQVELFTEWGHRWLDLKRTGTADAVMQVVSPAKGGTWNSYKQYWPIPLTELQNDPNLMQNPGYN